MAVSLVVCESHNLGRLRLGVRDAGKENSYYCVGSTGGVEAGKGSFQLPKVYARIIGDWKKAP